MSQRNIFLAGNITGLIWRLLIVGAIVPPASDQIVVLGHRLGLYGGAAVGLLHVLVVSALFIAIVIAEGFAVRRVDGLRRESLRKAQELEARLRMQIHRMPIACITISRDLIVTSWNPAAEQIFGYTESQIVGRSFGALLPDALPGELQTQWQRLFDGEATEQNVHEHLTNDGHRIVCRWTNTPLVADGAVVGALAMAEDITEKRRAENELLQSDARHRELLDQFPHFIFSVDEHDRFTAVNTATCRFFGRAETDMIGRTPRDLGVPPELARLWIELNAKTRSSGATQTLDLTIPNRNGVRSLRAITSPVHDRGGTILSGIAIDMTDLKAAEAAAHRLLRAVEQLDEVVFTTDRDGTITYVNPAFERVYGQARGEAIGQTPRILKSGEITREQYAAFWAELLAGRSIRSEYRNRRKDGSIVEVSGSASPVIDDDGIIVGFIAVQEDVTAHNRAAEEHRKFEERVGHLARMEALGTLAGGMAHDFNNILSIILMHTTLLERKHDDPVAVKRVTNTVRQAVQRGAGLARQILTFARRAEIKPEPVDITRLIMELSSMISETFPRTVQVTLDLDPDLPHVRADAGQIHQALLNLCVNARDAMPSGGELTIEARLKTAASVKNLFIDARADDYVVISVGDTGTGIDDETRKRIFEPFFTTKEKGKGTGLGLALVYGVVRNHGGLIDVESRVGKGTKFRLYLPLALCAPAPAVERSAVSAGGTETVLLIEDELALLDSVSAELRAHGYRVRTAENGADAIENCKHTDGVPDVVVMDLGMPKMSPTDLLRELREIAPRMPVLAMTGYVDPDVHASVLAAGVRKIVAKPFEIGELLEALHEVLPQS